MCIVLISTILESFVQKSQYSAQDNIMNHDGVKARKSQIEESVNFCNRYKVSCSSTSSSSIQAMIITGDLNWDDERRRGRNKGLDQPLLSIVNKDCCNDVRNHNYWIDAWKSFHPNQDGFTYDSKLNPMLKGNLRRRFDRCLYCFDDGVQSDCTNSISECHKPVVIDAKLIGTETIEGIEWKKEVKEWKYGKPTGRTTYQFRPVCPSDHFGLYVRFGESSATVSFAGSNHEKTVEVKRRKKN